MSENSQARPLRDEEKLLIEELLRRASSFARLASSLPTALVHDMDDGGMGSIKFEHSDCRTMASQLVEASYMDSDDVLVSISINLDRAGDLLEVDFWKVDFSPLQRYPLPFELK